MTSVLTLGGSAIADLESVEVNLVREQEAIHTLGNSRSINRLISGKRFLITLTLGGIAFASETERAKFLADTTSAFEMKILDGSGNYVDFVFPEIVYQTYEGPDIKGEDIERLNIVAIVRGTGHHIDIVNAYSSNYATGVAISS
jgi:hypothetical protein